MNVNESESSEVKEMHIGVAGLGKMGAAVTPRLIDTGHQVVVWITAPIRRDRRPMPAPPLPTPPQVDAVVTILTEGAAIDAVYNGPDGLLAGDVKNKLFSETSLLRSLC